MKLLIHTSYLAEYPATPLTPPIDPNALTGRTMEVTGAYLDPFTGDWLLAADVSDPVDSIPLSLLELFEIGFNYDTDLSSWWKHPVYNRRVEDEWGNSYDPEPPNFD